MNSNFFEGVGGGEVDKIVLQEEYVDTPVLNNMAYLQDYRFQIMDFNLQHLYNLLSWLLNGLVEFKMFISSFGEVFIAGKEH